MPSLHYGAGRQRRCALALGSDTGHYGAHGASASDPEDDSASMLGERPRAVPYIRHYP
jgi:hypothetical protein